MAIERQADTDIDDVIALPALVHYRLGAVVSRTVVSKAGGKVTAFAFDADEGLSEHTAPFDALALIVEGESEISIGGRAHRVMPGELLRLPAGQPHAVKAITRFKMLLITIKA